MTLRDPNRCPTHPGVLLREDVLPELRLSQGLLAQRLGVSRRTVSELLHARRAVTPDMALRLARLVGGTAEGWLRMQAAYDLWQWELRNEAVYAGIERAA